MESAVDWLVVKCEMVSLGWWCYVVEHTDGVLVMQALNRALSYIEKSSAVDQQQFLCGDQITLADVRVFPHLIRFDSIYRQLMLRPGEDAAKPSLAAGTVQYLERLFSMPQVQQTCDPHLAIVG